MSAKKKVLVAVHRVAQMDFPYLDKLTEAGLDVTLNRGNGSYSPEEIEQLIPEYFATIASNERYSAQMLKKARNLKVIARWGVGYDSIDVDAASRQGVAVAIAAGANHEAVADLTLAFMGGLANKLRYNHNRVQSGAWKGDQRVDMWRSTVGIVGLGRIGRAVARRCRGFDMRVLVHEIAPDMKVVRELGAELAPLDKVIAEADFLTLHVPSTPATRAMMNRKTFAQMKRGAYFINCARGEVVDEDALVEALASGHLAGAGLDVFHREPMPTDAKLLTFDNVWLSPHAGAMTPLADQLVGERCVDTILAFARGENPGEPYIVNNEALTVHAAE